MIIIGMGIMLTVMTIKINIMMRSIRIITPRIILDVIG